MIALETKPIPPDRPVAFLDRDGVIIHNRDDYVRSREDVRFVSGAIEAASRLAAAGFSLVIVTNQACIGRGLLSEVAAIDVHERITDALGSSGAPIAASYICPHQASARCQCRKPKPGMLQHALRNLAAAPIGSFMVGDAVSDIVAAEAAGVTPTLVLTGRGATQSAGLTPAQRERVATHDSLDAFVTEFLAIDHDKTAGADV